MIMRAGEPPQEVFSLLNGWAYRFMLLSDGRRQILAYYLPGNFVTLEAMHMQRLHFSVQALTDVQLCVFDVGQFKSFVSERAGLSQEVERMCVQRTIVTDHLVMDLGRRTAQEKLARMLMEIYVRLARRNLVANGSFTWPLRQEHVADTLGLTPVHVSRTFGALKREGLVEVNGQTITVIDESRLLMHAGLPEDYVEKQALRKTILRTPPAAPSDAGEPSPQRPGGR